MSQAKGFPATQPCARASAIKVNRVAVVRGPAGTDTARPLVAYPDRARLEAASRTALDTLIIQRSVLVV